ncbi:hypothetical protein IAR55_004742 [Kwoniella newhampshirensis]|uniref:Meiotically up-regulated protein Msb1/Mug8 domain-containing protein n=1 Tax=Kwoniella newhampshirensis TaxID=1651941 RepID=A0AAW0YWM4_9TREE
MMASLFSRSKKEKQAKSSTTSTPPRIAAGSLSSRAATSSGSSRCEIDDYKIGEFGTTIPTGSRTLPSRPSHPLTPPETPPPLLPPKHTFLPTRVPARTASDNSIDSFSYATDDLTDLTSVRQYGFLRGIGSTITLGVEDAGRVIKDIGEEMIRRALATPMLFSNQALELNQTRTKLLIQAYLGTLSGRGSQSKHEAFLQNVQFANEQELAWLLRWAMSRITRVKEGSHQTSHGVLEWEAYEEWRGRERAAGYPPSAFPFLAVILSESVYDRIIVPIFHLLSRFAAHSHLSGLTPHALSSLFAPLLFDIPTSVAAMSAHEFFVRAAAATEHLLLAYIRSTSTKGSLGLSDLPFRLKEWVSGYPAMVASDADLARGAPRRGARVVRCETIERAVRAYSKDLIVQSELWANDLPAGVKWDAWERVTWKARRGDVSRPRFSSAWRKRMMVKEHLPVASSSTGTTDLGRATSYGKALPPGQRGANRKTGDPGEGEETRWGSLAGKEWSLFEEDGFDAPLLTAEDGHEGDIRNRLQFDLTESAKMGISQKRQTMDWSDFASPAGGFHRTDPLLDISLTFSPPIESSIVDWPKERDELRRRLQKSQKGATPFNYDTTPKIGTSIDSTSVLTGDGQRWAFVEEAFVDCWADLMMGGGWIDREELTYREANWAFIEYRARPTRPESHVTNPLADPRTTDLCFLFEERVPFEYQMAVAEPQHKRTFGRFSPKTRKRASANAKSELIRSSSARPAHVWDQNDFDRMLVHRPQAKKMSLTKSASDQPNSSVWHLAPDPLPSHPIEPSQRTRSAGSVQARGEILRNRVVEPKVMEPKGLFLARKTTRRVKTDENTSDRGKNGQREQEIDYELRTASEASSVGSSPRGSKHSKLSHRGPRKGGEQEEEKWMDILIANGAQRMDRQDAPPLPILPLESAHEKVGGSISAALITKPHTPAPVTIGAATQYPTSPERLDEEITPRAVESSRKHRTAASANDDGPLEPASPSEEIHIGEKTSALSDPGVTLLRSTKGRDTIHDFVDQYGRSSQVDLEEIVDIRADGKRRSSEESDRSYFDQDHHLVHQPFLSSHKNISAGTPTEDDGLDEKARSLNEQTEGDGRFEDGDETFVPLDMEDKENMSVGVLKPPLPVFDLTPGREPSPARYRHGEPLHFVGEEPEEEDEEEIY